MVTMATILGCLPACSKKPGKTYDAKNLSKIMAASEGITAELSEDKKYIEAKASQTVQDPSIVFAFTKMNIDVTEYGYIVVKIVASSGVFGDTEKMYYAAGNGKDYDESNSKTSAALYTGEEEYVVFDLSSADAFTGKLTSLKYVFTSKFLNEGIFKIAEISFQKTLNDVKVYCNYVEETAVIPGEYDESTKLATAPKQIDISNYTINSEENLSARCAKFKKVLSALTGIDIKDSTDTNKAIILKLDGDDKDWNVSFDEASETVTISGGSDAAIAKAISAFFASASITSSNGKFIISDNISCSYTYATDKTNNSALLSYDPSTRDWIDTMILVEIKLDRTFEEAKTLVDFYAEAGVNTLWLCPVYEYGPGGNGYGNVGPHSIYPVFSGKTTYAEGWQALKDLVTYAHSKGVYILLDVISWGVMKNTQLVTEHPEWFSGEAWGNEAFNWSNEEFVEWYTKQLITNIEITDADGYRGDCEPNYAGYEVFGNVRSALEEKGKKIVIIAEDGTTGRGVYDFEQDGVLLYSTYGRGTVYANPVNWYGDGLLNIVDSVKDGIGLGHEALQNNPLLRGTGKYYTNCITNHDYQRRDVNGSLINIGYSAILAPFIPVWYMGDEFNATSEKTCLYNTITDYSETEDADNALFLESVKKLIQIRRTYSDIFEYWPENHRLTNICKVDVYKMNGLQAYARYAGNKAVLVLPNDSKNIYAGEVHLPFAEMGLSEYNSFQITDLFTGRIVLQGTKADVSSFSVSVGFQEIGLYLIEGIK